MRSCQIEFVSSHSDVGTVCGKPALATCADCGLAICSDCRRGCCDNSFCEFRYDYHVTHDCVKKPVQGERPTFPSGGIWFFTRPS